MTDKEKLKFQQFYNYVAGLSVVPMGFSPGGSLSVEEAFDVYANGYKARLTEALGETYESIRKFAGDEIFFEVCADYILKNPSTTYNLSDYGQTFPEYLKTLPAQKDYPFLYDLAVLDRNRNYLFHQRQELGIDGVAVQSKLKEDSAVSFVSSLLFSHSEFDVVRIWKELQAEEFRVENLNDYRRSFSVLTFKDEDKIKMQTLSSKTFEALHSLNQGHGIDKALLGLEPEQVTDLFKNLMNYRLIRDVA